MAAERSRADGVGATIGSRGRWVGKSDDDDDNDDDDDDNGGWEGAGKWVDEGRMCEDGTLGTGREKDAECTAPGARETLTDCCICSKSTVL